MADLPVDSIELESNAHSDADNSTLAGNTGFKKCINNTIREKNQNLITDHGFKNNQNHQRGHPNLGLKVTKTPRIQKAWKKWNNRVTQEFDKDKFYDNADKIDKEDSGNEQENENEKKKSNLHVKPGDVSAELNFTDKETYPSDRDDTDNLNEHPNFDNEMASFDKNTIEFLKKIIFI